MTALTRRGLLAASAAAGGALAFPRFGAAQGAYPSRLVRIIVPYGGGGATDVFARLMADAYAAKFGQSFIVENRAGAGGITGTDVVAKSAPDGYTLGIGSVGTHTASPALVKDLPYDPKADFTPIALIAEIVLMAVVSAKTGFQTLGDLIKAAKEKPNSINFASMGNGTSPHLAGELFKMLTGLELRHVPYRDYAMLTSDLVSGRVHLNFDNLTNTKGNIESGNLKVLAVSRPERWSALPDAPTFSEQGLAEFKVSSWVGLFGPAGLPKEVVAKLNTTANEVLAAGPVHDRLVGSGASPGAASPEDFARSLEEETKRWNEVIAFAKIQPQ